MRVASRWQWSPLRAAFFWLKRARRPAHPERRRRVEAALYCNPPVSPRASELQQGTSSAPTLYLWVRGPSGPLPPEAARSRAGRRPAPWWQWSPLRGGVFLAEAGQKARAPRAPPSSRGSSVLQPARIAAGIGTAAGHPHPPRRRISGCAGLLARFSRRRPGHAPAGDRLLGGNGRRYAAAFFLAEAGQKARAPRAPPSSRSSSVLQPAPIAAGVGIAAGHFIRPDAVSLGARAFWPASAGGGQVTRRPQAGSLVAMVAATRRRFSG